MLLRRLADVPSLFSAGLEESVPRLPGGRGRPPGTVAALVLSPRLWAALGNVSILVCLFVSELPFAKAVTLIVAQAVR